MSNARARPIDFDLSQGKISHNIAPRTEMVQRVRSIGVGGSRWQNSRIGSGRGGGGVGRGAALPQWRTRGWRRMGRKGEGSGAQRGNGKPPERDSIWPLNHFATI